MKEKLKLFVIQFLGTLVILGFVPRNEFKALALLLLWITTFFPISKKEIIIFFVINTIFIINNILAVKNNVFRFLDPNLWGLPWYEFIMWGFYLLHSQRVLSPSWPAKICFKTIIMAVFFSLCFSLSPSQNILFISLAFIVALSCFFFRNIHAYRMGLYMLFIGALLEYWGVYKELWIYPKPYPGGVAYWFIPMWFGIGFFYYYLIGPVFGKTHD